ncbi:HupE/UreJ family protein [endosymbiont of unidentified scaly snail isolate Monju]|uniref:HupE/UreJ family protein n=1 Tax=endosymbiont of unidentified scaly snail isolate Monju TaxID=1248727 RepID=UPI0003892C54|nr:HupE/UreJ family protein [endosymbiont of unidentified scaly snail isolate Monju]BAN69422.1 conserved hypothetical protein [endosymbiont of unidentified scaly snail isolate Monju]
MRLLVILSLLFCITATPAHELRPPVITVDLSRAPAVTVTVKANLEALLAGIGTRHKNTNDAPQAARYRALRALSPEALAAETRRAIDTLLRELRLSFDAHPAVLRLREVRIPDAPDTSVARTSELVLEATVPPGSRSLRWAWPRRLGDNVLRVRLPGEPKLYTAWLRDGRPSDPVDIAGLVEPSAAQVFRNYVVLGFTHIVPKGADHILFVLGLFLLSTHWRPLLYQVTAFTLAHTLTLGLSVYGLIALSPAIVEPLIAASIAFVAIENILSPQLKPWRVALVFGFGLLHGMGFAGVLTELGLPESQYLPALLSFNLGVELGQLAVIGGAWLLVLPWSSGERYRRLIVVPVSLAIAAIGLWWTWERIFLTGV